MGLGQERPGPHERSRLLRLSKNPCGVFRQRGCSPLRALAVLTDDSHTYGLRSIFSGAHVTGENDGTLFRACGRETLRGFFDEREKPGPHERSRLLPHRDYLRTEGY